MIKRDILPTSTRAPKDFLEKLTAVLNRGSIHSIADHYEGMSNGTGKPCDVTCDVCMSCDVTWNVCMSCDVTWDVCMSCDVTWDVCMSSHVDSTHTRSD